MVHSGESLSESFRGGGVTENLSDATSVFEESELSNDCILSLFVTERKF